MNMREEKRGNVLVLIIDEKRLDASKAPMLREEVSRRIDAGNHLLVFDLSETQFMDSSGLGALVTCLKRLGPSGGMAIAGVGGAVARLFALTRMDKVFALHKTVDEAVGHLAS
jgi:anti-sigma B factor antagonist